MIPQTQLPLVEAETTNLNVFKTKKAPEPHGFMAIPRNLVKKLLSQMKRGSLRVETPEGQVWQFGTEPDSPFQAAIYIHTEALFKKIILFGHIGFTEAYMDGDWDTPDLEAVIAWFILNIEDSTMLEGSAQKSFWVNLLGQLNRGYHLLRANNEANSRKNIQEHYDLGNDFFKIFLDPTLTYSSAYFTSATQSLQEAQVAKWDNLCQKLQLRPTDHLLEIGSGWGGFALYAVKTYGCHITTTTISLEQYHYVKALITRENMQDRIEILLCDYRKLTGKFDKIVSIEMIEAVGDKYYETYFQQCQTLLAPHGLLAIQMITCPDSRFKILKDNVDFIQKHIFPGSLLPSIGRVNQAVNKTGSLFLHDLEDMGNSYARTLGEWHATFNERIEEVRALGFDERFIRKWNFYFLYCKAAFKMRNISVVQAVYTSPNNLSLYSEVGP
jgi:cyclopropane-fatty-acyl-phospholipid synthase